MKSVNDKLKEVFERFNRLQGAIKVDFAYLFGSLPAGLSGVLSDIDIAVYFSQEPSLEEELGLHLFLSRELKTDRIDLLVLNTTKKIVLMDEIIRKGILVYEKTPSLREAFELRILHEAIDSKEHRRPILRR